jgi:membrane-bound ClpP family serine protease
MRVLTGLDRSMGLDLVIQTPGGDPLAAEGIVEYLQAEFKGDVRLIVPYCAYSAGTLIACATKSVIMGNHSCLGPVDPQLGGALPCLNIIKEFDDAREDIMNNPSSLEYWKIRLGEYQPGLYLFCKDAVNLGDHLLNNWLHKYMFAGEEGPELDVKIEKIYKQLNSNNHSHGRHFTYSYCKDLGLKVEQLENKPEMHATVMKLHHALEELMEEQNMAKLLLNQYGIPAALSMGHAIEEE